MTDQERNAPLAVLEEIRDIVTQLREDAIAEAAKRVKESKIEISQTFMGETSAESARETAEKVLADMGLLKPKPVEISEGAYRLDKTPAGYHFTEMPAPDPQFSKHLDEIVTRMSKEERIMRASLSPLPHGYRWQEETSTEYDFDGNRAVVTTQYRAVEDQ